MFGYRAKIEKLLQEMYGDEDAVTKALTPQCLALAGWIYSLEARSSNSTFSSVIEDAGDVEGKLGLIGRKLHQLGIIGLEHIDSLNIGELGAFVGTVAAYVARAHDERNKTKGHCRT